VQDLRATDKAADATIGLLAQAHLPHEPEGSQDERALA